MRRLLSLCSIVGLVACASTKHEETRFRLMAFTGTLENVYSSALSAADSMSWDIRADDRSAGAIRAWVPDGQFEITITVMRRPTGIMVVELSPQTPEVTALEPEYAVLVHRIFGRRKQTR